MPGNNGTTFNSNFAPSDLNRSISANGASGGSAFASALTTYGTSVTLAPGTYQISLLSGAQQRLEAFPIAAPPSSPPPVTEPASFALLGAGLLGLGVAGRRRIG